ncbi:MAG TPA: hypothetical protein DCG19_05745 [Cryomorphaceae bacterium]|nr:hypothetical protein [Owenweeksia sp.]HAD96889.1 hypothetical protein [Cryomorphaceae bacterium]
MKLLFSISFSLIFFFSKAQSAELYYWKKDTLKAQLEQNDSLANIERHIYLQVELASYYVLQDWNQAEHYLRRALNFSRKYGDPQLEARILVNYGDKLATHNDYPASLRFYSEALRLSNQYGRSPKLSGWLELNIGNLFYKLHNYLKASELYYDALMHFEKDGLMDGKAVSFNNIGLCALKLDRPHTALSYFEKGQAERIQLGKPILIAHSNLYLAEAYNSLDMDHKADSLLQYCKNYFKDSDRYDFFRKTLIELAKLEKKKGHYAQALKILEEDHLMKSKALYGYFELEEYLLKGELKKLMGNYNGAEELLKTGISQARLHNQHTQSRELYQELLDVYRYKNDIGKALAVSQEIVYLQDSVEKSRNEALFEILRSQNELGIQESENQQLEEINKESQAEIKERNVMLVLAIVVMAFLLALMVAVVTQSRRLKRTEIQLQESNQQIMAIMNTTDNVILSLDSRGRISLINKAGQVFYKHILGVELSIGDDFIGLLKERKYYEFWSRIITKSHKGETWQEVSQAELEGKTHYLFKSFSPIFNEKSEFQGLIMVGADFTESRKKSLELEKQKEELDQANTAKEKMLSILAHDLKDSIFSAKSLTDLVLENANDYSGEELLEFMELLNNNFSQTKSLLTGLLEWVKTQTHGMKASISELNIKQLSGKVIEGLSAKAEEKGITLNNRIPAKTKVMADKEMIRTVLRNLLANAIKYTFSNQGVIDISCEKLGEKKIRVHVKDNGQGISEYDQSRLFEIPGRVSTPGTANEKGTGFGLNLCQELLKLNGSYLNIDSKPGEGSDFYFDLDKV